MDENKPRAGTRSPSLLADNLKPAPRPSNRQSRTRGPGSIPTTTTWPRRRVQMAGALGLAAVAVAVILAFGLRPPRAPAQGTRDPVARLSPSEAPGDQRAAPGSGNAVIQPADPAPNVPVADAAGTPPVTSASSTPQDALARLARSVDRPAETRKAGRPALRAEPRKVTARRSSRDDGDVALLTALIQHVEDGQPAGARKTAAVQPAADPVASAIRRCPAANTRAGVDCIRKLCEQHVGQSIVCPAPAAYDAARGTPGQTAAGSD